MKRKIADKFKSKVNAIAGDGGAPLKIISIGGTTDVNGNLTVYEYEDDIIIVDCGIGFPDSDMPGVDVIIPDFSYVLDNKEKVKGLLITHAHEDHFGATPYLLKELNVPVYGTKLVHEFVRLGVADKISKKLAEKISFHELSPDVGELQIGSFKVSAFRMNHSVPDTTGFAIRTSQGLVMHVSDFKIDWTPVIDPPLDIGTIAKLGDEGVLCLLSDCLGVTTEGYSESEKSLTGTFEDLFERAEGRQLLVTTISTNLSRMHQIISAAIKHNRKVVLSGRSIRQRVPIGIKLGYLPFNQDVFITEKQAKDYLEKDLLRLAAGCYGQRYSALDRITRGEHRMVELEDNAMVIFSADPNPPGTKEDTEKLQDLMTLKGAEVIYSQIQDNLHVSGHGPKGDITMLAATVAPKYFIPIGGTITRMRAYKNMVADLGFDPDNVFENLEGDTVVFEGGQAKRGEKVNVEKILVEGSNEKVSELVLQDREVLSSDGVFVIVVPIEESDDGKKFGNKVEVISRGFVYLKEAGDILGGAKTLVNNTLAQNRDKADDWGAMKSMLEKEVGKFLKKKTGKFPMIIVHSMKI